MQNREKTKKGIRLLALMAPMAVVLNAMLLTGCVGAAKYRAIEDELSIAKNQMARHQGQIEALTGELDRLNIEKSKLQEERDQLTAANDKLSQALTAKKDELSQLVAKLNDENKLLQDRIADLTAQQQEMQAQQDRALAATKKTYDSLVSQLQNEITEGQVAITNIKGKLSVNVAEKLFFDSGKTEIKLHGREVLQQLGAILSKLENKQIRIEGHTDNVPIGSQLKDRFPTNWDLSAARAIQVVRFLHEESAVPAELLSATGYGQYFPIASNDSADGRAKNRRIEIVVVDKDVARVFVSPK